jgi:hypothetical protein
MEFRSHAGLSLIGAFLCRLYNRDDTTCSTAPVKVFFGGATLYFKITGFSTAKGSKLVETLHQILLSVIFVFVKPYRCINDIIRFNEEDVENHYEVHERRWNILFTIKIIYSYQSNALI